MSNGEEPSEDVVPNTTMMFTYISEEQTIIEEEEEPQPHQEHQQEEEEEKEKEKEIQREEEEEDHNENGFDGVVPASLAEVSGREETHTAHLVEGDFFPEDSPSRLELRSHDKLHDINAEEKEREEKEQQQEWENEKKEEKNIMDVGKKTPQHRSNSIKEKDGGEVSDVYPSWYTLSRSSVKRVRWADEVAVAAPLVQHATTFFLPLVDQTSSQQQQQQLQMPYGESDKMMQILSPPPVLREEKNTDGTTYLSCKAQRPAQRFVMWKRTAAASGHNAEDPPFKLQPLGNRPPTHTITLLAALHPPYRAENIGTTVQMRVATISQDAKKGEALCDGGLQMPMVRSSQLLNVPLSIPF
ncbi:uncharacterized protein TM35_000083900 [Trypanosoma theileri]|uniref:Uncharacterized protein n=1 Tax=Trypanosoma theileri TaxID=67003 RepID=A0A1X0P111_9TRYP|nr:uncharacterized protein TM35_000083900 [Trypanosoma theileri]ORC90592.1 hypothetical protein TM35_000083900 [Trypanosoma theileri]